MDLRAHLAHIFDNFCAVATDGRDTVIKIDGEIAQAARALWGGVHGICILAVTGKLGGVGVESVPDLAESLLINYLDGFTGSRNP